MYMRLFKKSKRSIIYVFGNFSLLSLALAFINFLYVVYMKLVKNIDLDQTPLTLFVLFFFLLSILFLFIGFLFQAVQNSNKNTDDTEIEEISEN